MITQKLIAEKSGVSYATVSRALTNSAKVSPETLQRIRKAMDELGITGTEDLFLGRNSLSKMVLVVVGDITNDFYANLTAGISRVLNAQGYSIVLYNSQFNPADEMATICNAQENGYAGIILCNALETDELVDFLHTPHIPVVMVNRYIRSLDLDVVRIDNYRGGYMAAQHLIENGHRKIAHLTGPQDSSPVQDRLRGFTHAMQDNGLTLSECDILFGDLTEECGKSFANWLAKHDYTAAYINSTYMTVGAVRQLHKLGKNIPEYISVICFDDTPMLNEDNLNITAIGYDTQIMGSSAADVLLKRISDPLGQRMKMIYSPTLICRESVRKL